MPSFGNLGSRCLLSRQAHFQRQERIMHGIIYLVGLVVVVLAVLSLLGLR